jgi:hypothetical protein
MCLYAHVSVCGGVSVFLGVRVRTSACVAAFVRVYVFLGVRVRTSACLSLCAPSARAHDQTPMRCMRVGGPLCAYPQQEQHEQAL